MGVTPVTQSAEPHQYVSAAGVDAEVSLVAARPDTAPNRTSSDSAWDDGAWAQRRIALFVNSVEMGGVEEHVRQLAAAFVARGVQVLLICPESDEIGRLAAAGVAAGAKVFRLTLSSGTGRLDALRRFFKLVRLLRSQGVDVLHVHLTGYTGGRWAILAGVLARTPAVVCTLHIAPANPVKWGVRLDRRFMNLLVDRFIAVSHITRGRLIRYLGLPPDKTAAVPNAVELHRYRSGPAQTRHAILSSFGIPDGARIIGCVARLSHQKGIAFLIESTPALLAGVPDAHVVLVGDGPLRAELEQQAVALGVRDRIHFVGRQEDIPSWLAAMDVFVLPSLFEGLPLSILEAMAAGLPVVATAVDGTPEAVEDGATGRLVPSEDAAALAAALVEVLATPGLAARLGAAGRARAELYSESALVERLAAVYGAVLTHKRRGAGRPTTARVS
jgi:glycosyltransferase involved in cell wall biosynthesis